MTVKELISQLSQFDPELEVYIQDFMVQKDYQSDTRSWKDTWVSTVANSVEMGQGCVDVSYSLRSGPSSTDSTELQLIHRKGVFIKSKKV